MNMLSKVCLVIIDNCQREFLGIHLFCHQLSAEGIKCILVPWNLPIELYYAITKSIKPEFATLTFLRKGASAGHIEVLNSLGVKILVHENEGYPYERMYEQWRDDEGWNLFLPSVEKVYLWGSRQKRSLERKYSKYADRLVVAGSIRLSAVRESCKLSSNNMKSKRLFIVLSSSIPYPRYLQRSEEFLLHANTGIGISDLLDTFVLECVDVERAMAMAFVAKNYCFKELEIAIRPHPYASIEEIKEIACQYGLEHALVGTEVPIWAQLVEGDILIHAGSTSALEAEALGIPVFNLRWIKRQT